MKRCTVFVGVFLVLYICLHVQAYAAGVPQWINYEGMLTDQHGNLLQTEKYDLVFKLYNKESKESAGDPLWGPKKFEKWPVTRGKFNVILGQDDTGRSIAEAITPNPFLSLLYNDRYLEIEVNGKTIPPRQQILSAPFALVAGAVCGPLNILGFQGYPLVVAGVDYYDYNGAGYIQTAGNNNNDNVRIGYVQGNPDQGYLGVCDEWGTVKAGMYPDNEGNGIIFVQNNSGNSYAKASMGTRLSGSGFIRTRNYDGKLSVHIEDRVDLYDGNGKIRTRMGRGYININNDQGDTRVSATVLSSGEGFINTLGSNGNDNVRITSLVGNRDHGYVSVCDANGTTKALMAINSSGQGVIQADVKNFRMANPLKEGTEIWYACVEGPEAAAYNRGTARLIKGKATVRFPLHFKVVTSPKNFTVLLTALSPESKGLAVVSKGRNGFIVEELFDGAGTYDFDYLVMAVRKNYENYQVIRPAADLPEIKGLVQEAKQDQDVKYAPDAIPEPGPNGRKNNVGKPSVK